MSIGKQADTADVAEIGIRADTDPSARVDESLRAFWSAALAGAPTLIELPTDRPRPLQQDFASDTLDVRLQAGLVAPLRTLGERCGVDLHELLLAAWAALLGRLSNQHDVVIGTLSIAADMTAASASPLPVRIDLSGEPDVAELFRRTQAQRKQVAAHRALPLARIVDTAKHERSARHAPLFQAMLAWRDASHAERSALSTRYALPDGDVQIDLCLDLGLRALDGSGQSGEEVVGELIYATVLFDRDTVERIVGYWQRLLHAMADIDPSSVAGTRIVDLPILPDDEQTRILDLWNAVVADYPQPLCLHESFEAQAARTPDAIAVVCEGQSLSYGELNRRANRLARRLRAVGLRPDDLVAICMRRTNAVVESILATLKAGAAYLPMDLVYPTDRLAYMLEDAAPKVVLADEAGRATMVEVAAACSAALPPLIDVDAIDIDAVDVARNDADDDAQSEDDRNLAVAETGVTPDRLAYVIYTSGSTGKPKGVMIEHRHVGRLMDATDADYGFGPNDVWTLFHSYAFDFSVWEIWGALRYGGRVVVVPIETARSADAFYELLCAEGVTVLNQTPSAFRALIAAQQRSASTHRLREVIFGGEALELRSLKPWYADARNEGARLVNMYGITETTVHVTFYALVPSDAERENVSPVGVRIDDLSLYVLDEGMRPCPRGVIGELYVGGAGVARGYLNRPELTAERFVEDPFRPGERLYKSGDLARWLADGSLDYIGRNDFQVKIRGFRIELGEIEARLAACEGVREAVVLAREDAPGDKQLVAYYESDVALSIEALRETLSERLPAYMIPSAFVWMPEWPLTPNGKLDRRALPAPDGDAYARREYEAPASETETALAAIWETLLRVGKVGRHDHFFEIGGHSLLAVQMMSRVRQALGVELMQHELFDAPVLAQLAARIDGAEKSELSTIETVPRAALMPLSLAQQRMWFLTQIDTASSAYHIYGALRLRGTLDAAAFERAMRTMIARHEALRTRFVLLDGEPMQAIDSNPAFALGAVDLRDARDPSAASAIDARGGDDHAYVARERACAEAGAALFAAPFDLRHDVPLRAQLVRLDEALYELQLVIHHIVADGWSMGLIYDEISRLYAGEVEGTAAEALAALPALPIQYVDYAAWQRERLSGERLDTQSAFWRRALAGAPPLLEVPTDRARPTQQDFSGAGVAVRVEPELTAQLKALARKHGATLYMTLLGSWALALGRLANQDDVVVGSPVAGRQRVEIEALIGFFVNTLALRVDFSDAPTVAELLARIRRHVLDAQTHQELPFDQVVEAVKPPRNTGHTPIFQAMLALQNQEEAQLRMPGIAATEVIPPTTSVQCDLLLNVSERDGAIVGTLDYATALFDAATAERFRDCWLRLLRAMVEESDRPVSELTMLDAVERHRVLETWNDTAREYPRDGAVHTVFETQAARTPHAPALTGESGTLDYAELNRRANRIAHRLIALGVAPDDRVAICMERSVDMVIGFLAILKAGAGYVPIDPTYPHERRAYLLKDCAPTAILTTASLLDADWLVETGAPMLAVEAEAADGRDDNPAVAGISARGLAYVIYTSGSTGEPKGVLVEHRNILRLAINNTYAPLTADDCVAHCSNPAFDASTWEIWGALLNGARLLVVPGDTVLDPQALNRALIDGGATALWLTVGLFNEYLETLAPAFAGLNHLLIGGDALDPRKVAQALAAEQRPKRLVNGYGPTETTTFAVTHHIERVADGARSIPIGRPIANTRVYLLDSGLQPVPAGVSGELYTGGDGVARGYLNRPDLTAERFLRDPFVADDDARMYKTGDLCRWLADGTIEFLGRNDFQVKIRGFRIELGEIEARLVACADVREAVVLARSDRGGAKRLVAYCLVDGELDVAALRESLATSLPDYMMPSAFVRMESWPLTANGKLDRKALPEPEEQAYARREYEAPEGESEILVAETWAELLKLERVGRHDNFFELGGHSLIAVRMIERLRKGGMQVDIRSLFTAPTLKDFAAGLHRERSGAMAVAAVPPNAIPADAVEIAPGMLPLVSLSQAEIDSIVADVEGGTGNIQDIYPLSPLQEGILFHSRSRDHDDIYLITQLIDFPDRGRLDQFVSALEQVVHRHDILRTGFFWSALSEPVQVVHRRVGFACETLTRDRAFATVVAQLAARFDPAHCRLDLSRAPLFRLCTVDDPDSQRAVLAIGFHHLVMDHTSLDIVLDEAATIARGNAAELPVSVPFRDYIWQARINADREAQTAFFTRMLADIDQPTAPFGLTDMNDTARGLDEYRRDLPADLCLELRERARVLGVGAATMMHLAWAMMLARATGMDRVVFGTVLFGRMDSGQDSDRALGLFINTLPVRIDLGGLGVADAVKRTQAALAELLSHEHASLAVAQRCSGVPAATPLFTSIFNYRYSGDTGAALGDAIVQDVEGGERTNFPLALSVDDYGDTFGLVVQVMRHVGAERVCDFMQSALEGLMHALRHDPASRVDAIDVLPTAERERILVRWNDTARDYPRDLCVHRLFEDQAAQAPQALALIRGEETLSYAELNTRANRLAHHLIAKGVAPGQRIAICVERSVAMVVAVLAVLKAGAAYLPLDPDYPRERLAYQLGDAQVALLLADGIGRDALGDALRADGAPPVLALDSEAAWRDLPSHDPDPQSLGLDADAAAYMIYTSGSTGLPKGTLIAHRSAVNLACAERDLLVIAPSSRVLQFASFAFDACVWEMFATFCAGATLVLPAPGLRLFEGGLIPQLRDAAVSHATLPPALLSTLPLEEMPATLRTVVLAGEAPEGGVVERLLDGRRVINAYGPTEATVCATMHDCTPGGNARVIGGPLPNASVYVLDEQRRPAPIGVVGEIYIGGAGVACGYWNRPELTAERFVRDPFAAAGARMYRTGDLGRWLDDGTIEFLGRNDFQVKIRGFRIELGEIEAQLLAYPGVREAVVLAREDRAAVGESRAADKRLIAYLVADAGLDNAAIRTQLAQTLPDYMVPAAFVRLDAFPLTPNGKLDRKALPAPESDAYASRAYEPPQGRAERAVAAIWQELLRVDRVGRHDNFFELGGHSLIAVTMIERMRRQGMQGDVRALFTTSSLAGFAAALREADGPRTTPANAIPNDAQRIEPRMLPLVTLTQPQIDAIAAQVEGGVANIQDIYPLAPLQEGILFHRMLAEHGDLYHATVLVRFADRARIDDFLSMMQQVIDRHDILRTSFVWKGLNTPVQVVQRRATIAHDTLNLNPADGPIGEQLATHYAPGRFGFDLTRAPLFRFGDAFDPSSGQWLMCLAFHHLILDHTSLEVIMEEATLIGQGRTDELLPPVPFRNYIWQVKVDADPAAHQAFFSRMLGDIDRPTAPFGLTQTSDDLVQFDECVRMLPADISSGLRRRARELGVSAASLMHLAWAMVLARSTGLSSVVFGTVLFGRMGGGEDADRALGLFINTLPIRIDIGDAGIVDAVKRTHKALAELLPHEHAPLVDAQRCSAVPASMPLFTSLINYTYSSASASFRSDFHMEPTAGAERTNYPLAIAIDDQGDNFEIGVQVLPAVGAARVCDYLQTALAGILLALDESPSVAVSAIEVMPASEHAKIVDEWNDTARDFPLERCAHVLFSEQVARDPQALALVFGDERIAYGALNARANRIAHSLRARGIGPGTLVAVALERGIEMIATLLGVLKAGGAYVPMATDAPADRIAFMLDDAAPALLLAHRSAQLPERPGVPVAILEDIASELAQQPESELDLAGMHASQPAYVIYTSGTTGTPKGVVVSHRNLVNFVYWCRDAELIGPGHSMTQFAPYTFDASAGEIFAGLLSGGELHLLDDTTIQSPPRLQQYLLDRNVRFAALPPAYLQHMDPSRVPDGFRLLTAGSAPTPELVQRWAGRGHYLNGYGPTETTILSTSTWLSADEDTITIGRPIANTRLYLLDEQRRPVPIGVPGEIWIGGEGVTPGYLNRPELTAERYLDDPFDTRADARMYKTGDLGRWMADGAVEFLGRNDFQVKIRGFRIELGEIENRLCAFDGVREAVVLAREDGRGEKRLVAYYLADEACDTAALRQHVGQALPDYMMPAAYVWMQAWPLTANGKIDRKALPEPDDESYARHAYAAPENAVERALCDVWAELLGVDRVGRFDHFFDLGGHSLLAMRLVSRIRDTLGIELPLRALFEAPVLCDLAERLGGADVAQAEAIPSLPRGQLLPLSLAQQRLWFLTRIEGASAAYHMGGAVRLRGALDTPALLRALQRIVDRHESLRTRFVSADGQPMLSIAPQATLDTIVADLRGADDADAQAKMAWATLFEREYDLAVDLPLRAQLLRLRDDEYQLHLTMHHIVSDGWSIGVILSELGTLYAAELEGGGDPLPPLSVQYADYAAWQRDWLERGHAERLTTYWAKTLADAPTLLELPTDRPRPPVQDFAGDMLTLGIDADLTQRLRAMSQRHGVTLYMTLLASWAALLCRLSTQDDVVIGTPMAGRNRAEIETLVGFFVNTVALRIDMSDTPTVAELLERCKQRVLEAQAHQDVPFDRVVEAVRPPRSTAHTPIFQTMLTLNNRQSGGLSMPGLEVAQVEVDAKVAQFDIALDFDEGERDIVGTLSYATALFDRTTIERYADYWSRLLHAIVDAADQPAADAPVSRLPMLDAAERHALLTQGSAATDDSARALCLHRMFEERAAAAPQATALICGDARLSYAELNARANRIAHRLIALGVGPDTRVLVCLERGIDAIVALLAVLKAGGGYVPADPHLPAERIRYFCEDCAPVAVVSTAAMAPLFDRLPADAVLYLDREPSLDSANLEADPADSHNPVVTGLKPEHLAYVIYTSGSTGQPKGVEVEHRSVVARIDHAIAAYALSAEDRCLQFSSLSFDASAMQMFSTLGAGAALVMRGEALWAPETVAEQIAAHGIAVADIPPSYLQTLFEADAQGAIPSLRIAIVGGEATLTESIRGRSFGFAIFNEYGPTEATITATALVIEARSRPTFVSKYLPIGKPIADTRAYILDRELQPVPVGVAGELHIGGVGVARGYLNRPDLTDERFVADPFVDGVDDGAEARTGAARMYKTGDLARWLADGTIEYLGRNDFQVKLRGFRIELGEIESLLLAYAGVREAAVLAREDVPGQPRLVAYCLSDDEAPTASLRDYLAARLPDYMVPAAFVRMRDWPLTTSGKLDRRALPAPDEDAYARNAYTPPQNATERAIASVWQALLGLERVGRDDHFFDLGGHSILMLRMIRSLAEQGISLGIQDVYRLGTVAAIAAEAEAAAIDAQEWLRSRGWNYADGVVDGQRVLWLAPADEDSVRAFKRMLPRCAPASCPQRIVFAADPAAARSAADSETQTRDTDASIATAATAKIEVSLTALDDTLRRNESTIAAADVIETLPFSAIHRETLQWNTRDGLHVVPLPGWWSSDELRRAFAQTVRDRDMLRVAADERTQSLHVLGFDGDRPDGAVSDSERVAWADLRGLDADAADRLFSRIDALLRAAKARSRLSYAATLISRTDTEHALVLYGDHLAWDGQSFDAIGEAMLAALSGVTLEAPRPYREFLAVCDRAHDPAVLDRLASAFDAPGLAATMRDTSAALAAHAALPPQVVAARIPLKSGAAPAEQAFALFRRFVSRITGLERFGMVLTHHGRQLGECSHFGQVGLFVDKIPIQVCERTTLDAAMRLVGALHRDGVRFVDWQRSGDARVAGTLPQFFDEISFNYQAAIDSDWETNAVGLHGILDKMNATRGILCEFYVGENDMEMLLAFRGDHEGVQDVKANIESVSGTLINIGAGPDTGKGETPLPQPQTTTPIHAGEVEQAIVVDQLRKRYSDTDVVKGISFSVPRGSCFGILGPNGAGKTSLLGMIEGIVPITSGRITVMGMDVATQIRQIQPRFGVQLQYSNYFQFLTVSELLNFYSELRAAAGGGKRKLVPAMRLLERLDLADKMKFKVDELSGGQKQRLSIALAMLADPEIVFLDEPTAALDPHSRRYTWEFIEELKQDRNRTIVLTTHYMEEAERLCDEIMIMNQGEIVGKGNPSSLIAELNATQQTRVKLDVGAPGEDIARAISAKFQTTWDAFSDSLLIATDDVVGALREAMAQTEARDVNVLGIHVERLSLEDVFLNKTGKELKP